MVQIIVWMIVLYVLCKLTGTSSTVGSTSLDNDIDAFIAMDLVSDGEIDGDFNQRELNKHNLCLDVQWSA